MKLRDKETGDVYDVLFGSIAPEDKRQDVNGAMLQIRKEGTDGTPTLYIYKYWSDNDLELVQEH